MQENNEVICHYLNYIFSLISIILLYFIKKKIYFLSILCNGKESTWHTAREMGSLVLFLECDSQNQETKKLIK